MGRSVAVILLSLTLLGLFAGETRADVSGFACFVDGDTMSIGGKRTNNRCVGGVFVDLFGIDAPELEQICWDKDKRAWRCGLMAASTLLRLARNKKVVCTGTASNAEGHVLSICTVDGMDLSREMARLGFAFANTYQTRKYEEEHLRAQARSLGIWQFGADGVMNPSEWRSKHNR